MKKLFSEIPYIQKERITLREVSQHDAAAVKELTEEAAVYRYLPTFLFEKKYEDISYMISHLYDECFRESLILGIYLDDEFCGLAEMYGYCDETHKISVGHRLMEKYWGKGRLYKGALFLTFLENCTNLLSKNRQKYRLL